MRSHSLDIPQAPSFKGLRLAPTTIEALEAMAYEGIPLRTAAERFEIRPSNLQRSFESPRIKAVYNQLIDYLQKNNGQEAYLKIKHMSETSANQRLKFEAAKWIAGVGGISPVRKATGKHQHEVLFGGFEYPDLRPKDVTPKNDGNHS